MKASETAGLRSAAQAETAFAIAFQMSPTQRFLHIRVAHVNLVQDAILVANVDQSVGTNKGCFSQIGDKDIAGGESGS